VKPSLTRDEIVRLDRAHVWHPYTPIDVWEKTDPIVVARAEGCSLYDADGTRYIDGNSSWWVAGLGHGHPRLLRALREQAETLVHCALGGIAHEPSAALAAELVRIAPPGLTRVFYTDNGSTSVEVAVKVALQTWQHLGAPKKTRFVALDGAFHGDTLGASSLGGVEVFRRPFASVLFECVRAPFPEPAAYERAFAALCRRTTTRSPRSSWSRCSRAPPACAPTTRRTFAPSAS
jgi:adenosylmethionine-8-amino-7-oxononanoate aminotransferase